MEQKTENRECQNCKGNFVIEPEDFCAQGASPPKADEPRAQALGGDF